MIDPADRFIDAATAPLADNAELQMMAAQELRAGLPVDPAADAASLTEAAANLAKPRMPAWLLRLSFSLVFVAAVAALIPTARDFIKMRLAVHSLIYRAADPDPILPALRLEWHPTARTPAAFGKLSPQQILLLFGDISKRQWSDRYQALWDSDPENPALLADFGRASTERSKSLPANFVTTAARIDPGNGWFPHIAAGIAARKAAEGVHIPYKVRKKGGSFPTYRIADATKAAEALDLLQQAAAMPRYETYEDQILLQRLAILPPGDNWTGRKLAHAYLSSYRPGNRISSWPNELAKVVAARAWELGSAGDRRGLEQLAAAWETCVIRAIQHSESTPSSVASASYGVAIVTDAISSTARKLDLPALAARHDAWRKAMEKRNLKKNELHLDEIRERSSLQFADSIGFSDMVETPSPVTDSELKPGRMADHALIRRFSCAGMIAVFVVAAFLLVLPRFLRGNQARRLSHSLNHVLQPVDHAWILGGGVFLPFVIFLLLDLVPSLGLQQSGILAGGLEATTLRFMMTGALVLLLPIDLAGRRLGRRLRCLGWDRKTVPERWTIVATVAVLGITILVTMFLHGSSVFEVFFFAALAIASGFVVALLTSLFEARNKSLFWLTCVRAALPSQIVAVLLATLASFAFQLREIHWVKMDTLSRAEPGVPATNRYEYQAAEQLRKELLETLDAKP